MATLTDLIAQRAELDKQIAAAKGEAIEGIKAQMALFGVTLADLGAELPRRRHPNENTGQKRAIKYRDANGNTWTGVGQRPRWLRDALLADKSLEDFAVPKSQP